MDASVLPNKSGNYLIVLRDLFLFPRCGKIHFTPQMTSIKYQGKEYWVLYAGKSSSLRSRDFYQHFTGNAGISTFRKSIGCLMEFQLISHDANSLNNGRTTFSDTDEKCITGWMMRNLLLLYYVNEDYKAIEKELIHIYNPPLNLQNNRNKINADFRRELSTLRLNYTNYVMDDNKGSISSHSIDYVNCPNCGINLIIPNELKNEKYIKCLSCGSTFINPFFQTKGNENTNKWKWPLIVIAICIMITFLVKIGENSSDRIAGGGANGPSTTEVMANIKVYLKYSYLKDPDSYQSIEWGPSGVYNREENLYFMMHKYRAKNSLGGYVIEEKLFVLNSAGKVLKIVDSMREVIDGR